ncbi:hypothetical protein SK128_000457, partial [Halocaridina rubra]
MEIVKGTKRNRGQAMIHRSRRSTASCVLPTPGGAASHLHNTMDRTHPHAIPLSLSFSLSITRGAHTHSS